MNVANLASAVISSEPLEAFGGGGGSGGASHFVCGGGFAPDIAAPTCEGLDVVWRATQTLSRDEFRRVAVAVMDAVWTQPPATDANQHPVLNSVSALLNALNRGWAYNANEGDCLFMVFADIRPIERGGRFAGVGTRAPDGAIIRDGRDLVAWRERRWNALRGPAHMKAMCQQHPLQVV